MYDVNGWRSRTFRVYQFRTFGRADSKIGIKSINICNNYKFIGLLLLMSVSPYIFRRCRLSATFIHLRES